MTRVQGNLKIVTGAADDVTEVWVRAARARPVTGGWLMTADDHHPVSGGVVDLELLPGACVLVAVTAGEPGEKVEMIVPDSGTASLEACIRAAESAGELERAALDELRRDFGAWIDEARKSVSAASESATAAKAEAGKAATSATNADKSATAAAGSADAAGKSATAAASSRSDASAFANAAKGSADAAGKSATAAGVSAGESATSASVSREHRLAAQTASEEAVEARKTTWTYRTAAMDARDKAVESATGAAGSADAASKSASAAAGSASAAKADVGKAASSATAAGRSATAAKTDADRAANVAASTSWSGDRLTVNGKTSPSLTGPRGQKGDPGDAAKATETAFGSIKLAGDLGGTSDEPRVVSPLSGSIVPFEGDRQAWAVASGLEKTVDGNVPPGAYYTMTKNTVFSERAFRVTPGVPYYFAVWIRSDKPGQKTYLEVRKHGDLGTQSLSVESGTIGASDASYFIGDAEVPTEWTLWETVIRFKPSASKLIVGRWYPNHPRGKERNAQLMVGDIMLTPLSPDLEARKSVAEVQRLAANAVGNEDHKITRNGSANQLVKTGTDGSIWIQTVAVTDQHHATNKAYVDGAVNGKADVSHKHAVADITDLPEISDTPTRGTLVQRSPRGTIRCNDPEGPNNAANKAYVDRAVWDKADKSYVDTALQSVAKGAFDLRVASSAPASGTASNVITFVKE